MLLSVVVVLLGVSGTFGATRVPVILDVADWCEGCSMLQTTLWSSFQKGLGDMVQFNVWYGFDSKNQDLLGWTACAQDILAPANNGSDYTWFGVTQCVDVSGFTSHTKTTTECIKEIGMQQSDASKVQECMQDSAKVTKLLANMATQFNKTAGKYVPDSFVNGKKVSDYDYTVKDVCAAWTGKKPACCSNHCDLSDSPHRIINEVNAAGKGWTAGINEVFRGRSTESLRRLMGVTSTIDENATIDSTPLPGAPDSFDPITKWPKCTSLKQIRNQAECGSCWAFGAVESFTDRYCIAANQAENPSMSAEYLVSCDDNDDGCSGGMPSNAWNFIQSTGLPTTQCQPYTLPTCPPAQQPCIHYKPTPQCQHICYGTTNQSITTKYYVSEVVHPRSVAEIQKELMTNGPIEVVMTICQDFLHYKSGVYSYASGQAVGKHAVKMMGWGTENGTAYWLVANSWTTSWGDKGFFKIRRGVNECGIESKGVAGIPKVSNV